MVDFNCQLEERIKGIVARHVRYQALSPLAGNDLLSRMGDGVALLAVKPARHTRERAGEFANPLLVHLRSASFQRAPAAAAIAGFPTFTLICFGFASSRFGMLSVSTPF
jgi:hypothetical protein